MKPSRRNGRSSTWALTSGSTSTCILSVKSSRSPPPSRYRHRPQPSGAHLVHRSTRPRSCRVVRTCEALRRFTLAWISVTLIHQGNKTQSTQITVCTFRVVKITIASYRSRRPPCSQTKALLILMLLHRWRSKSTSSQLNRSLIVTGSLSFKSLLISQWLTSGATSQSLSKISRCKSFHTKVMSNFKNATKDIKQAWWPPFARIQGSQTSASVLVIITIYKTFRPTP